MDTGSLKGAVLLNLSKAFDRVDHHLLLKKLTNIGLTFATTHWFRSYLTNRSQITSVGNAHSAPTEMPVGVPQGSILGPLLFLIYINDLWDCHLASDIIIYADDTVIYYSSKNASPTIRLPLNNTIQNYTSSRIKLRKFFWDPYPEQFRQNRHSPRGLVIFCHFCQIANFAKSPLSKEPLLASNLNCQPSGNLSPYSSLRAFLGISDPEARQPKR